MAIGRRIPRDMLWGFYCCVSLKLQVLSVKNAPCAPFLTVHRDADAGNIHGPCRLQSHFLPRVCLSGWVLPYRHSAPIMRNADLHLAWDLARYRVARRIIRPNRGLQKTASKTSGFSAVCKTPGCGKPLSCHGADSQI